MSAFWTSLGMLFLAELGDKTQLVAMTMATRFRARTVVIGTFSALLAVMLVSVSIGTLMGEFLPTSWIKLAAGFAFIAFGLWTIRGDRGEEEGEIRPNKAMPPFVIVFLTFFLAEMGDKTMLSAVTLAATNSFVPVLLGALTGMAVADGLGIIIGTVLGSRLPERPIQIIAAAVFFLFGAISIYQAGRMLPLWVWYVAPAVLLIFLTVFLTDMIRQRVPKAVSDAAQSVSVSREEQAQAED